MKLINYSHHKGNFFILFPVNPCRYYNSLSDLLVSWDSIKLAGNNPNFYAYVFNSNVEVDPLGLDGNWVRIQSQANCLENPFHGIKNTLLTAKEGIKMLDELVGSLTKSEKSKTKIYLYYTAKKWINNAGKNNGVDAPVSKAFLMKDIKEVSIDIEIIARKALVG